MTMTTTTVEDVDVRATEEDTRQESRDASRESEREEMLQEIPDAPRREPRQESRDADADHGELRDEGLEVVREEPRLYATKAELTEGLRGVEKQIADVRLEIADLRTEMVDKIGKLRTEMVAEIGKLRQEILELEKKILSTALGIGITLLIAIIVNILITFLR